ncbi:MAG: CapA family protein [Aristaeellaceae bacterium]
MTMKRWLMLLSVFLLLPLCTFAEEAVFDITWADTIRGYQSCEMTVTTRHAGQLTLVVNDGHNDWLRWTMAVSQGENRIPWNGLGDNDERIPDGTWELTATLVWEDGEATLSRPITFERCRNAVIFALPGADTMYLDDGGWFAEVCLVRAGTLVMEVSPAEQPSTICYTKKYSINGSDPYKLTWNGKDGSASLPAGEYVLRYYAANNTSWVKEIHLTIREGSAPVIPLQVTGEYLPAYDDSDEAVWQLMQKPSAVVDIRFVAHQEIYEQPDKSSPSLGQIHGQSQAVDIKELREDGWAYVGAWNHDGGVYVEGYIPQSRLKMVQPNSEYGLLLDKAQQRMTLFYQGKRIAEIDVSTGLIGKNKLYQETAAGSFLTVEHLEPFSMEGKKYDYVIRYDGGNLLHQLPYRRIGRYKDFAPYTLELGQKASHGCIRLPRDKGESGINAYWLWTHLPYHTRLIILDDPEQRQAQAAAVSGGRDPLKAMERVEASTPASLAAGEQELVLTFGGDAVLGTREAWWNKTEAFPAYITRNGMAYPFSGLQSIFAADDLTMVNLECVLKETSKGEDKDKLYRFRGLPSYTGVLTEGSIELVNIANNHYIDYGKAGKDETRAALEQAGIPYSGYGYTWVWEKDGYRVGFGGCRETTYRQNKQVIAQDVDALKAQDCDVIIYLCHWGTEYSPGHNTLQEEMAAAAAEAGVDIVIGAHPHVVQGVDTVDGTLVVWSLGNLMFGGTHDMTTFDAALAQLRLRFDEHGYTGCTLEMIPILTSTSASIGLNDFRPVVVTGDDRERIWNKIQADSGIILRESMYFPARQ